jgi:hypothetical protein
MVKNKCLFALRAAARVAAARDIGCGNRYNCSGIKSSRHVSGFRFHKIANMGPQQLSFATRGG